MIAQPAPAAPKGLTARSRKLWAAVFADGWQLSPAEQEVLRNALVALDRADQAAEAIARDGVSTPDRYGGVKANPLLDVEARCRGLFARLVQQLGLRIDPEESATTRKARAAAYARWGRAG